MTVQNIQQLQSIGPQSCSLNHITYIVQYVLTLENLTRSTTTRTEIKFSLRELFSGIQMNPSVGGATVVYDDGPQRFRVIYGIEELVDESKRGR